MNCRPQLPPFSFTLYTCFLPSLINFELFALSSQLWVLHDNFSTLELSNFACMILPSFFRLHVLRLFSLYSAPFFRCIGRSHIPNALLLSCFSETVPPSYL